MASEQTDKPTRKKLEDARKKGQVARSRDLALAAASVAATFAVARLGGRLIGGLEERLTGDLLRVGDAAARDLTAPEIAGIVTSGAGLIAWLVGPIAITTMAAAVGMHGFQGGWSFAPGALTLNWSRLNPGQGIKRFGLSQSGVDTLKTMITVSMLVLLSWGAIDKVMADALRMAWLSPAGASMLGWSHAEDLLWQVSWGLGFLAIGDYGLQYYRLISSLKMTKQEIRDEGKQNEGNAEVKGKMRSIARQMARRRMLADVPKATVVIVNPTHFAVAIEYRRDTMAAPRVIAKGVDNIALKIREIARTNGIPIIENKPLAQTLYKTAEIGETIPAPLFAAVAEILAYLVRIKQLML